MGAKSCVYTCICAWFSTHNILKTRFPLKTRAKDLHGCKNANSQGLLTTMDDGQGWPGVQFMWVDLLILSHGHQMGSFLDAGWGERWPRMKGRAKRGSPHPKEGLLLLHVLDWFCLAIYRRPLNWPPRPTAQGSIIVFVPTTWGGTMLLSRIIRTPKILEQGSEEGLVLFALTMLLIDHR